jgi:hypothetical protein
MNNETQILGFTFAPGKGKAQNIPLSPFLWNESHLGNDNPNAHGGIRPKGHPGIQYLFVHA